MTLTDNNIVGISLTDRNVFFFSVFVFGLTTCFGQCFKFKKKERERKKKQEIDEKDQSCFDANLQVIWPLLFRSTLFFFL